jgi:hypothetical protein
MAEIPRGRAPITANCGKCAQPTELLTVLPKFGEHPTYHIAQCLTCGHINWFPQSD